MKTTIRALVFSVLFAAAATRADAYPLLQLDILGGHYDPTTQTIVSAGKDFTLVAILTPKGGTDPSGVLAETYYISAAVSPQAGPVHSSIGSFSWNGTPYDVTEDMVYGTPPLEAAGAETDPGDLGSHGTFPTFFQEFEFQFTPAQRAVKYDSAVTPGGLVPTSATSNVAYYMLFQLTTDLPVGTVLHFDLYSSGFKRCGASCSDEDIKQFAPFSHDAESNNNVPEPTSAMLLSLGLVGAARRLRRQRA